MYLDSKDVSGIIRNTRELKNCIFSTCADLAGDNQPGHTDFSSRSL